MSSDTDHTDHGDQQATLADTIGDEAQGGDDQGQGDDDVPDYKNPDLLKELWDEWGKVSYIHHNHDFDDDVSQETLRHWIKRLGIGPYGDDEVQGSDEVSYRIPRDALIYDIRCGAVVLGRSPLAREYQAWGTHSAQTIRERFGSWDDALDAADLPPPGDPVGLDLDDLEPPESVRDTDTGAGGGDGDE